MRKTTVAWLGALGLGFAVMSPALASPLDAVPLDGNAGVECGGKGQPDCPLQGWMKKEIAKPKAAANNEALAANLSKIPAFAPKSWADDWKKISDAGAKAAQSGDKEGINASCKSCHDKYRKEYQEKYRKDPLPTPAPAPSPKP